MALGRSSWSMESIMDDRLVETWQIHDRINHYLLEAVPDDALGASLAPKFRTIGQLFAHMHNVRVMWLKVANKDGQIPESLNRATATPKQALHALEKSRHALSVVISGALEDNGRIKGFRPDVAGFLGYLISHDAHHRGQIAMLARQVGHPLPQKAMFGMWEWGSR